MPPIGDVDETLRTFPDQSDVQVVSQIGYDVTETPQEGSVGNWGAGPGGSQESQNFHQIGAPAAAVPNG